MQLDQLQMYAFLVPFFISNIWNLKGVYIRQEINNNNNIIIFAGKHETISSINCV